MYIFRYASQTSTDKTVCIALQQAPLGKGLIDFFPAEGVSKNMLTKLGDCIIGRVKNGVTTVLITEYHLANVQVDPVDLRIDRIDTSAAIMRNFAPPAPAKETSSELQPAVAPGTLKLIGHIQSRGDVTASQEWLGERQGTTSIEGFLVDWAERPDGVDLAYTSTVAGSGPSPKVLSGHYCGTRGKATPLSASASPAPTAVAIDWLARSPSLAPNRNPLLLTRCFSARAARNPWLVSSFPSSPILRSTLPAISLPGKTLRLRKHIAMRANWPDLQELKHAIR
jgi:hypothetical protein